MTGAAHSVFDPIEIGPCIGTHKTSIKDTTLACWPLFRAANQQNERRLQAQTQTYDPLLVYLWCDSEPQQWVQKFSELTNNDD